MLLKQQQLNNLEQFINLTVDLEVKGNLLPIGSFLASYKFNDNLTLQALARIILQRQFKTGLDYFTISDLILVDVKADLSFRSEEHCTQWRKHALFSEYSKYKEGIEDPKKVPNIVVVHQNVLRSWGAIKVPENLYQVDGMHRVMSFLEAGFNQIGCYVLMNRKDLSTLIVPAEKEKIFELGEACQWFPKYHEIREIDLEGQRKQKDRYTKIYDLSNCLNKTVVDFGCNIGQTCLELEMLGAKVLGFEIQQEALTVARRINDLFGFNIAYHPLDFNSATFEKDVTNVIAEWDWAMFLAIYRTKEIKDIQRNFDFIVERTKEIIFFEGHADPRIDTIEYYMSVFKRYAFKEVRYLGHSDTRPAFKIHI